MPKSIGIWEEALFGEIMNQKLRVKMEDKFKQWNGVKPHIVAEPYCGSWSRPFPHRWRVINQKLQDAAKCHRLS